MTYSKKEDFYWLTPDSRLFLQRGYLLPGVQAEQRVMQIAQHAEDVLVAQGFKEFSALKFYHYMSRGYYSLSSPIWANFGLDRGFPISCFGLTAQDSMQGIAEAVSEVTIETKIGGGTSGYLGLLRPRGSAITNNGESDGSFSFARLFDITTDVVSQGTSRKGMFAGYINIEHGDIHEWLNIKQPGNPIQNMFYGVCVSRQWFKEMKEGDIEKRKLWAKVLQSRKEIGIPYIFFTDNANDNKPLIYKQLGYHIYASNLCVSGDTKILTSEGYEVIEELAGSKATVWNGSEWSEVDVVQTGSNQELVRVTTSNGQTLDCTPYHKFYVQKGYKKGSGANAYDVLEVRAKDLREGDKLIKFDLPIIEGSLTLDKAYQNGFYSGDGCITPQGSRIYLYGEKKSLESKFDFEDTVTRQPEVDRVYGHVRNLKDKFFVPTSEYTVKSRLEWLAGIADADGTVTNNNGSQSIQIGSTEENFLKEIQLMLQTLGCDSKINVLREQGNRLLPLNDGSGELGEFECKTMYRLLINGNSLYKLSQLGFKCNRLNWVVKLPNRECSHFNKVTSVENLEGLHDTFCFTEPKRNLGMFNGILTGQCTEIMLPADDDESFVCCLSSMNVENYDEWKDTDAAQYLIYFLDAVMTDFIEKSSKVKFLEKPYKFAYNHRALGLGVLGWHTYLQNNMIPFDSFEAMQKNAEIFKGLQEKTLQASEILAEQIGQAPIFDNVSNEGPKRRNTTLMAVAPTKSSSFILGAVSQGIEPIISNYHIKDLSKIMSGWRNPALEKVLEDKGLNNEETWKSILDHDGSVQHLEELSDLEKDVFKTFSEISQLAIIQQAASRQKFIDQGQSINIMIHPDTPTKDVNSLYVLAEELGIKSLYYQNGISAAQELNRNLVNCSSCEA